MTVENLKRISLSFMAAAVAFVCFGLYLGALPVTIDNRNSATWSPPDMKAIPLSARPAADRMSASAAYSKNLFRVSRRPFDPAVAAQTAISPTETPPAPVPDVSSLKLKGIRIDPGHTLALIVQSDADEGQWYAAGDSINGWKISKIDKSGASLVIDTQTRRLELYVDNTTN